MGRTIGAFFAGFLMAMVVVIFCQSLNLVLYPLPEGLDPQDTEALAAHIANSPTGALLGVLASYFFGCFAGGAVATRIGRDARVGIAVGLVLLLGGLSNLAKIPHPLWFQISSTLLYIPSAWLGATLAMRRIEQERA